jgi:hypothetical protein
VAIGVALRFAVSGKLTTFDRIAGSVAVALSAGALVVVTAMAALAEFGLRATALLFTIGGGASTAREYFGPMAGQASVVMSLALLGLVGLGYATYRLWRKT